MKTLLLIRHAKAAAYGNKPGDHARPLAEKGNRHTTILAGQLSKAGIGIDLALVSTSQRTRDTWDGLRGSVAAHVLFSEKLYLASAEEIKTQIWVHSDEAETLAVIGHNPGIAILAWQLLEAGTDHETQAEQLLRGNFKTGFAARFDVSGSAPKLVDIFDPRDG